ncbi:MAG: FtsX-like permease family protein [Phycisphaeraceae bacterium]|nr:MAG: FtsX-like permease family protein [Phycisphaeraceae bacterium]
MIILRVLVQTVALALGQIWANKARAFLTALGIIIGVASVTAVIAALTGMRESVLSEFETFGARKIYFNGYVPREQRGVISWDQVRLTPAEWEAVVENAPAIEMVTPITSRSYEVRHDDIVQPSVRITGIWPSWHDIEDRFAIAGRQFTRIDNDESRQVCMVNEKAIEELGLDRDPTGDSIFIDRRRFLIIGLIETKEVSPMFGGGDSQAEIYIPFSTAKRLDPFGWNYCIGQMYNPEDATEAMEQVRFVLRKMRGLDPEDEDTFRIEVIQQYIDQFSRMAGMLTAIAGGVVSISLLVGGVGIMNIMLVSVSERTREIGLRKAVGARPAIILLQFLVEAVTLCLVGGLIGLVVGQTMTIGLASVPGIGLEDAEIPTWAIVLAFAFSAGVGVLFGMFPAIKAARLDPIEALRHE